MSYSMDEGMAVAKQATADITIWLHSLPTTVEVQNVEREPNFQRIDVDLIWTTKDNSYQVEIKGDRWHKTGNFFFETLSNREKETPGCFMYTQADWLFYYFVTPRTLYMLPMPTTREWFVANIECFRKKATTTPIQHSFYTTVGCLVPIARVMQEVPGVKKIQLRISHIQDKYGNNRDV